jgi:hypothetical protein
MVCGCVVARRWSVHQHRGSFSTLRCHFRLLYCHTCVVSCQCMCNLVAHHHCQQVWVPAQQSQQACAAVTAAAAAAAAAAWTAVGVYPGDSHLPSAINRLQGLQQTTNHNADCILGLKIDDRASLTPPSASSKQPHDNQVPKASQPSAPGPYLCRPQCSPLGIQRRS